MNLHSGKLQISRQLSIPLGEINLSAIRSQGAGGQNVNKVASAIHLRFDIRASSLPDRCKARLLALQDQRITRDGVVVIKAQTSRSREKNRDEALNRLRTEVDRMLGDGDLEEVGEHRDVLEAYRMFAHDKGWERRLREAV